MQRIIFISLMVTPLLSLAMEISEPNVEEEFREEFYEYIMNGNDERRVKLEERLPMSALDEMAVDEAYLDALKILLEQKQMDPNTVGKKGWTPLFTAVVHQNLPGISLLLNSGAFIDVRTLLVAARHTKDPKTLKTLLASNAMVNLNTRSGLSALTEVVMTNELDEKAKVKIAQFLLAHGARPDIAENNKAERGSRTIYALTVPMHDLETQPAIALAQIKGLNKLVQLFKKHAQKE